MALSALLVAHGVAHVVGFAVPWRLVSASDVPYRTTLLAGTIDVGIVLLGLLFVSGNLAS